MNNYLAEIIDAANEGIYVTDLERRFLVWNKAAEKISGYSKDDLIGRFCHDNFLCHTDLEGNPLCASRCPLQSAISVGGPKGPDIVYLKHKNGKRISVEVKTAPIKDKEGNIIGGVEIFQDVTERLEREHLLVERKEKLETVLDNIGDGILFLDTAGTITMFNHTCAEMFALERNTVGYSVNSLPEDLPLRQALGAVEQNFKQFLSTSVNTPAAPCPEGKGLFRCWTAGIDRSQFAPRSRCYACETYLGARTFLEKPRDLTWGAQTLSVVSSFIELRDSNELWEVLVFHDVTAEKLDAALKVAGAAAHELRQPLQAIMILAGLMKSKTLDDQKRGTFIENILEGCGRMNEIIVRMNEITSYRTKEYIGASRILDITQSSKTDNPANKH